VRKQLKFRSDVGDPGIKDAKEATLTPMVESGGDYFWQQPGFRRLDLCWTIWQEFDFNCYKNV
jgi:hypothetical protein